MNMKILKMSLANIQGKLSRAEMRKVMAGTGECTNDACGALKVPCCSSSDYCSDASNKGHCITRPLNNH